MSAACEDGVCLPAAMDTEPKVTISLDNKLGGQYCSWPIMESESRGLGHGATIDYHNKNIMSIFWIHGVILPGWWFRFRVTEHSILWELLWYQLSLSLAALLTHSLWPSDIIWRHGSRSALAQVMASCLMAPSHYLNLCWLMISDVLWHSPDRNFPEAEILKISIIQMSLKFTNLRL